MMHDVPNPAGLDTSVDLTPHIAWLEGQGIAAVGRYYSRSAWKLLKRPEAEALSRAGIAIFPVYQDRQIEAADFCEASGRHAARSALACACEVGQPTGTAIYFAVDYDPPLQEIQAGITRYFRAVREELGDAGMRVGVYGSGLTCETLLDNGLADFAWLSQSTHYRRHDEFYGSGRWAIAQQPTRTSPFDHDPCELTSNGAGHGGFVLPGASHRRAT